MEQSVRMTLGNAAERIVDVLRNEYRFTDRTIIERILVAKYNLAIQDWKPSLRCGGTVGSEREQREFHDGFMQRELWTLYDMVQEWELESEWELDDDGVGSFEFWMEWHGELNGDAAKVPVPIRNLSYQVVVPSYSPWIEWADDLCGSGVNDGHVHDFANAVIYSLQPGCVRETMKDVIRVVSDLVYDMDIWV